MAKRAGLKNDGKWFRTNKVIAQLNETEKTALKNQIVELEELEPFFDAYRDLVEIAGLEDDDEFPTTKDEFAQNLVDDGIPRQVYMGVLSYDSWSKEEVPGQGTKYKPVHQEEARKFGSELRKVLSDFLTMRRQARDLANVGTRAEGNPGGDPDGTNAS